MEHRPHLRLLNNRIYIGEIAHKDRNYPGEHEGIIDRATWDKVQAILEDNKPVKVSMARTKMVAPLKGVIRCGHCGCSMGSTYARKNGRHYTYYICQKDSKQAVSRCQLKRIPAGDIEQAVIEQLSAVFRTPTLVAKPSSRPGTSSRRSGSGCSSRKPNSRWSCRRLGSWHSN